MSDKRFQIAIWNANGLINHVQELKTFIVTHNLDIILISEAHMTEKSYIKIPHYTVYHTEHPQGRARGGTAVIIKNIIKHYEIDKCCQDNIQATTIVVEDCFGKLVISAVYCPPNQNITKEHYTTFFKSLGNRFIAGGDYNAKHTTWGSRLITPRGRQLYQAMQ